jgi:hypothetical protein
MSILHGDFRLLGDNQVGSFAAMVFAIATRARSDSGSGGSPVFRHGPKIKFLLRAGADLLARRLSGTDFDGCRTLGRYFIARMSARLSSSVFPLSFVFSPGPPDLSVSTLRRLKTNLAPSLPPEEGRGRSFSPRIVQDEFPAPINAGVCR